MKKLGILLVVLSLFSLVASAQVDDSKSRIILDNVSAKLQSYTNFKIDFTYTMVDKAHGINESMNGKVAMKGKSFNLDFMGRTIIGNGETVWAYSPDDEEVTISSASESDQTANPWMILTDYNKSFKTKLIKSENEGGRVMHVIDMVPKEGKSYFKIRVKIDKSSMRLVSGTIYNKDGVTYSYRVKDFTPNATVSSSYFVFDKKEYPDADIIDLR